MINYRLHGQREVCASKALTWIMSIEDEISTCVQARQSLLVASTRVLGCIDLVTSNFMDIGSRTNGKPR